MNLLPKVSICIPTYNGEAFVEEALASAIAQTYPNLEIIISDDYSQDRTLAIVEAVADTLPNNRNVKIQILKHQRYGLVGNWNHCLHYCLTNSNSQYIKFLFQDDVLEPDCIAEMVKLAEQDAEIGLVFCRRQVIYSTLNLTASMQWLQNLHQAWYDLKPIQKGADLFADRNFLHQPDNKIGEPSNVLIRTAVLEKVGLFDPNLRQFCDWEMWLRIMSHAKVAFCNRELASFRVHAQQTTNRNVREDIVWAEIYQVWLKLVTDPIYQTIAIAIRKRIYQHIIKCLSKELLSSLWHRRWHRLAKILQLFQQVLF